MDLQYIRKMREARKLSRIRWVISGARFSEMKRPVIVTAIGILFILAGGTGFVYHFHQPYDRDFAAIELVRLLAVLGGVFMLLGHGWARWLVIAWMTLHVAISALDSVGKFAFHLVLLLVIGYALVRPPASEYFRAKRSAAA
jgi:hypothetical protein